MQLGKAKADKPPLHFESYFNLAELKSYPEVWGNPEKIYDWPKLLSDENPTCVLSGFAYELMLSHANPIFTDRTLWADHHRLVEGGAVSVVRAAEYRRKRGLADVFGKRHKCDAYLALPPGNIDVLIKAASVANGVVGIGVQFPNYAFRDHAKRHPWKAKGRVKNAGGLYFPVVARLDNGDFIAIVWGKHQVIEPSFIEEFCDEAFVFINTFDLVNRYSLDVFDSVSLRKQLERMT